MKKVLILIAMLVLIILASCFHYFYAGFYSFNSLTAKRNIRNGDLRIVLLDKIAALNEFNLVAKNYNIEYLSCDTSKKSSIYQEGVLSYNKLMIEEILSKGIILKEIQDKADSIFKLKNYELAKEKLLQVPEVDSFAKYLDSISNGKEKPEVMLWIDDLGEEPNGFVGYRIKDGGIAPVFRYVVDFYNLDNIRPTSVEY